MAVSWTVTVLKQGKEKALLLRQQIITKMLSYPCRSFGADLKSMEICCVTAQAWRGLEEGPGTCHKHRRIQDTDQAIT